MKTKNNKIAFILAICYFAFPMIPMKKSVTSAALPLESKAECVMELNSRRILYESNGDLRLPMASTTKILTAATVLEHCNDLKQEIRIPKEAVGVEGSSVYLKENDVYSIESLLYGLMLRSGNDCATALALSCSGSVADFSVKMNAVAQKAGAFHSRFSNPHGLPNPQHYTTARDLSYITCYAMQNPIFCEIVATKYYPAYHWTNKNKMLTNFDGAIGVKTGYTKEAGRCLVSAATRENMTLVCSVLNCPTMYERSSELLSDAFAAYRYIPLLLSTTPLDVKNGEKILQGHSKNDYYYPLMEGELQQLEIVTKPISYQKVYKDKEIIGQFEIFLAKRLLFSGNLYKL